MTISKRMMMTLVTALFACIASGPAAADYPAGVEGLVGLRPAEEGSCIAVWVPIPDGQALAGFSWYNNDGGVVFPEVLLESGAADSPVTLAGARSVATDVQGESLGWSGVILDEPVACLSEGLYLLLRFPEASEYTADGPGGGAALGYRTDGLGCPGWLSADGRQWTAFSGSFGFAIEPEFVAAPGGGIIMKGARRDRQEQEAPRRQPLSLMAYPNPFNPSTTVRFNLPDPGRVEMAVYDLRGARVKRLASEVFTAGPHDVRWQGRDDRGRTVASGVYFVLMRTKDAVMTRRLVLVQ
ncbi:hypothetical protein DRQ50_09075 [bacterium]|nr:MAG: hypothetical protein DRQ50_09075 [bacterium]